MKYTITTIATAAAVAATVVFSGVTPAASAGNNAFVVTNPTTKEECSACHMAYPPGFLPKRSWQAIMSDLSNHFGEDASLDDAATREITNYLVSMAPAEIRGLNSSYTIIRISQMPWFTREHGARRVAYAKSRADIGSISNCTACHRGAERGYFDDD